MTYKDPEKQREYMRLWNIRQRTEIGSRQRQRRREKKDWVNSLKDQCERCGYNNLVAALEYHHVDPATKEASIADAVRNMWTEEHILAEINKCKLLCANCHREVEFLAYLG